MIVIIGATASVSPSLFGKAKTGEMYRATGTVTAKRMAPPEETAVAASFLLDREATFITGSDLLIDGGVMGPMKTSTLATPRLTNFWCGDHKGAALNQLLKDPRK